MRSSPRERCSPANVRRSGWKQSSSLSKVCFLALSLSTLANLAVHRSAALETVLRRLLDPENGTRLARTAPALAVRIPLALARRSLAHRARTALDLVREGIKERPATDKSTRRDLAAPAAAQQRSWDG